MQWNMSWDFIQPREGAKYRRIHYVLNDRHHSPDTHDSIVRNVQNRRIHRGLQQITGCWGPREEKVGRYRVPSGGDKNVLEFNSRRVGGQVVSMPLYMYILKKLKW